MSRFQNSDIRYLLFMTVPVIVVIVLGYLGFLWAYAGTGQTLFPLDLLYLTLQLFALQSGGAVPVTNWALQIARFLAPIVILSAFAIVIWIIIDYIQKIRLQFLKNHVVVCGLGYLGREIALHYAKTTPVIVIERDQENDDLLLCRTHGISVVIGDATKREVLESARVNRAQQIYLVTGRDDLNAEIAVKCEEIIRGGSHSPVCGHVHLENRDLWQAFLVCNKERESRMPGNRGQLHLDFFNLYQIAGFCVLREHPPFTDAERGEGKAHVLVLGIGRMGETLILRMIRKWEHEDGPETKITITGIDLQGKKKHDLMKLYYQDTLSKADLSIREMDLTDPEFLDGKILHALDSQNKISRIYICIDNSSLAISTVMSLLHMGFGNVPIILRSRYFDGIPKTFELLKKSNPRLNTIVTFPIVSSACCRDMIINGGNILRRSDLREIIGRAIHEQYREKRSRAGAVRGSAPELLPWKDLPVTIRESNLQQADHIDEKLRSIGCGITILPDWPEPLFEFTQEEIDKLARMEHDRFVKERLADGWKLAKEKNIEKKESPYLISYDDLTDEIKGYDIDAVRQIPEILARVDLKICREMVCLSRD